MSAALDIRGLTKEYVRGKPVLRNLDLSIGAEGITAIIGPSGTGKSTLLRCINRLVEPTKGEIRLTGAEGTIDVAKLRGRGLRLARRRIGMVFQEYNLVERLSVMENVLCGRLGYVPLWRAWLRKYPEEDIARAFALLDAVGLPEHATRRADALSGGQRQRVGIARALMQRPDLLLADEPTSSLDPRTSVEVLEMLTKLAAAEGVPVIINIHNVALAKRYARRIVGMHEGAIIFDGPPEALQDDHLRRIYGGEDWL
ncbi:phosphonate ABC transporter ATP-binding protein [Roseomonas nepalensis]|uniref:Phosphonate ABC transporter ATP-binding protein n=1 Tax=Muricoccus nepalensis TaxID=1854500 RepID=A0A502G7M3_9PROT|nr:phosphonate ABC transporter ATP-binding protein [Roseomonas nepalensis]TPG58117.1 phosphonate ABC transporter ATP-binding protein [Roseomonas nepalensis]